MRYALVALIACSFASPAFADVVRGTGGLVAIDSNTTDGRPSVDASGLTLLVGASEEAIVVTDAPVDDAGYGQISINGVARFDMLRFNGNNGGTGIYVDSNGYVSFDRNNRQQCRGNYDNDDLSEVPSCRAKRAAVFWDDLIPTDTSTITRGNTSGTADDFWYVQWNDFALVSNPDARLSFRVTYFENGRYLRYNYIKLEGVGSQGAGATVGLAQCTMRNRGGDRIYLTYSFDNDSLPTGTAVAGSSLFAIEISFDNDGDGLPAHIEAAIGTSDSNFDTDGCGEGDGAEYLNGRDPLSVDCVLGDDLTADMDGDGLVDSDEIVLGTDPAVADTDGDGASDFVEISAMGTDPLNPDMDGDGFFDGIEDANFDGNVDDGEDDNKNGILDPGEDDNGDSILNGPESDPFDANDIPGVDLLAGSSLPGVEPNHTSTFKNAAGDVYIVAEERGTNALLFAKVMADGSMPNPAQRVTLGGLQARKPHLYSDGTTVRVAFISHGGDAYDYDLRDVRVAVASWDEVAEAGKKVLSPSVHRFTLPGIPTHWHAAFDGSGTLHVVYDDYDNSHQNGRGFPGTVRYAKLDPVTGAVLRTEALASYRGSADNNDNRHGIHRVHNGRLAIDAGGMAHLVWVARTAPGDMYLDDANFPNGTYYARIPASGSVQGPYYLDHGANERIDIALHPSEPFLYYAATNGEVGDSGGSLYEGLGIRFAVVDVGALQIVPRLNDAFGVPWAVSESSFVTPLTSVFNDEEDEHIGPKLTVLPDGNAAMTMENDDNSSETILFVSPYGQVLHAKREFSVFGREDYSQNRRAPIFAFGDTVAVIYAEWNDGDWRWATLNSDLIGGLPAPDAFNAAPVFTSMPPAAGVRAGSSFTYQPTATDDGTVSFSILAAPAGATMDAGGAVSWQPTALDLGDNLFSIRACDDGVRQRCAEQSFIVNVIDNSGDLSPVIVSRPPLTAYSGLTYRYILSVDDAELPDDSFTYAIASGQSGDMAIDNAGLLSWNPTDDEIGVLSVQLRVTDASGRTATQTFSITVLSGAAAATGGAPTVVLQDGGCSQTNASSLWALLAFGLLFFGLRRREARDAC